MDCARARPRFSAAACASGSLDVESPYPVTLIVAEPRFAAKAFTSAVAGTDRLEASGVNTIVAEGPDDASGIGGDGAGTGAGAGAGPAALGRAGADSGSAGTGPAAADATCSEGADADAACVDGAGVDGAAVDADGAGAASGALRTALRGAGDGGGGGAVTAGIEALASPDEFAGPAAPDEVACPAPPACPAAEAAPDEGGDAITGAGGGAVPTPNRVGDAAGEDGSASGADWAACWAFVRSAISESVSFFSAAWSGAAGFAGTDDIFGYGSFAPGGAGRSCAILPPSC